MKLKSLILAGALCLGSSAFLSAKTRIFTVDEPTLIGNYNVPPGTYRIRVHGNTAELTDLNHFADKKPVKISTTQIMDDQRHHTTVVNAVDENGRYRVTQIDLRHSRESAQFQQ